MKLSRVDATFVWGGSMHRKLTGGLKPTNSRLFGTSREVEFRGASSSTASKPKQAQVATQQRFGFEGLWK